jgi:hypothetical protein
MQSVNSCLIREILSSSRDECPIDRATDLTDADFQKTAAELADVEERKSAAELKVQQAAADAKRRAQSTLNQRQQYLITESINAAHSEEED